MTSDFDAEEADKRPRRKTTALPEDGYNTSIYFCILEEGDFMDRKKVMKMYRRLHKLFCVRSISEFLQSRAFRTATSKPVYCV